MDAVKVKTTLMMLTIGESRSEKWFLENRKFTAQELDEMISKGLLIKVEKDPKNFMSDVRYSLTQAGYQFAWQKSPNK